VEFRILGPLEVIADDGRALALPAPQQRAVLALLVLNANRVVSSDRVLDEVWNGNPPASGAKALAFHVSRLRDALAPGRRSGDSAGGLETEAGGYVLRIDPEAIDAARFERLARDGHARLLAGDAAGARDLLAGALALWRGEALADVAYAELAQAAIRRLDGLRLGAQEDRLEAELELGGHTAVIGELEALVAVNPLRERLRGLLMLALYRAGRQAEALRVAGDGRRLVSDELGIDPSPELLVLEGRILAQDPGLDVPRVAPDGAVRPRNPYKGLRAFSEADAPDFFGREALVRRLLARLAEVARTGRILTVAGPSGSGKSSVVRAGLVPALRASGLAEGAPWRIAVMVPGTAPVRQLAAALAATGLPVATDDTVAAERDGDLRGLLSHAVSGGHHGATAAGDGRAADDGATGAGDGRAADGGLAGDDAPTADDCPAATAVQGARLLLVIDQLEELFVRVEAGARDRFLAGLLAVLADPSLSVVAVATLRADFLHLPLALPEVGELVREGLELVTPLTGAELERAIVRPAEMVGVEVVPALVVEIVDDVERRPGVLPLLEYALTELFERSDGRRMTRDGYAAIGGAPGALGRRADEAWLSLDADGRDVAQQVLLALVEVGGEGTATACRVPRAAIVSLAGAGEAGRVAAVVDHLGRHGLLTFDIDGVSSAPTVEVAHEALLAHWSRLAGWIEDLRDDLRTRQRLADAAAEWEAAGRAPAYLAAGAKLDRLEAWAHDTHLRLPDLERTYLAAAVDERARLARADDERATRERRRDRRARLVRWSLGGAIVVLATAFVVAVVGRQEGEREQADVAAARELAAASIASLGQGRQLSLLLALEAADATVSRGYVAEEAYDALHWALQEAQVPYPAGDLPVAVRASPGGPRGVPAVAPQALMRLASDYLASVNGSLDAEQCRMYLRSRSCPPVVPPADGNRLGLRTTAGVVSVASLASAALTGTRVHVLSELPADASSLLAPFARESGVAVTWDRGTEGDLEAAVKAGDLPDIAIVARPSIAAALARQGWLVDLEGRVDTSDLEVAAGEYATALGVVRGPGSPADRARYAAPFAASVDDLLWYPREAFAAAGYLPPTTLAELDALVASITADGGVPWCFGIEDGARTGAAAASWAEDLFLARQGLAAYDAWVAGSTAFGSQEFRAAVESLGSAVMGPADIRDGIGSVAYIPAHDAWVPMLAYDPPGCWLYRGATTNRRDLASDAVAVRFPSASSVPGPVVGRLYSVVVLRDRPEVRRAAAALISSQPAPETASAIAAEGVFLLAGGTPSGDAGDAEAARLAAALRSRVFRARAADVLPEEVGWAFLGDMTGYLSSFGIRVSTDRMDFSADAAWVEVRAEGGR
jgi:DNA-binding SARP family transcriptional activator